MWRLRIAEGGKNPNLSSKNNFVGRQIWEFDADTDPHDEELVEVEEARRSFSKNRSEIKIGSDLLWRIQFLREKKFRQKIPRVSVDDDAEDITYEDANTALRRGVEYFSALQAEDGHWPAENAGPLFFLPPFVMCLYITGHLDEIFSTEHRKEILRYIYNHQNEDGGWGLHVESHSVMFCTVLNYVCLRILGTKHGSDACERSRKWILDHGGATYTPLLGKALLSILGVYEWSGCRPTPPEFWMLPSSSPINGGTLWIYCRMIFMPLSYLYGKRFVATPTSLVLRLREELYPQPYDEIEWKAARHLCAYEDLYCPQTLIQTLFWDALHMFSEPLLTRWPFNELIRQKALKKTMELIHYQDKTSHYISGGCLIKSLCMLACWIEDPEGDHFKKHLARVPDYIWIGEDGLKIQSFGSQLWDTCFSLHALLATELIDELRSTLVKGYDFLKKSQITEDVHGDYKRIFRYFSKGAWTFSDKDHGWPSSDCTAESLECCLAFSSMSSEFIGQKMEVERLYAAVNSLLVIQSNNGGMPAWEPCRGTLWLEWLNPVEFMEDVVLEHEYVECTASALVALVRFKKHFPEYRKNEVEDFIANAANYIESMQLRNGSWYGNWGVCFFYGTWFALRGLVATEKSYQSCEAVSKAVQFLLDTQNEDGGWGESYLSCPNKEYTPMRGNRKSNVVNTAQAMMGLILSGQMERNPSPVTRAAKMLIESQMENGDFTQEVIMGAFKKNVMLHYPNFRNIFPLWALAEYTKRLRVI